MPLQRVLKILSVCFLAAFVMGCGSGTDRDFPNFTSFQNNDAPVRLEFQTVPQRAAGSPFGTINVAIKDFNGITVGTDTRPVTIALTTPGGATLSGTTTVNAVNGVASFSGLSVDQVGTYTFTATANGLLSAESAPFTITAGAPGAMGVTFLQGPPPLPNPGDPLDNTNSVTQGMTFANPLQVEVRDANGNLVTNNVTVTMVIAVDPSGRATLGGTTQVPTVNGVATFTDLTIQSGGGVVVLAAAVGQGLAVSDPFLVQAPFSVFATTPLNPSTLLRLNGNPLAPNGAIGATVGADFSQIGGMIAHPDGRLLATGNDANGGNAIPDGSPVLLEINPATGAGTLIGALNNDTMATAQALAVNPATGVVYTQMIGPMTTGGLYTVNTTTGAATLVGANTFPPLPATGMAIDPYVATGPVLYAVTAGFTDLFTIDLTTGAATSIGSSAPPAILGMTINPFDTSLFAVLQDGANQFGFGAGAFVLVSLDKTSGAPIAGSATNISPAAGGSLTFTFP